MKKVDGKPCKLPENPTNEDIKLAKGEYCPFCQRVIYPSNVDEFMNGEHDGFIFVHDDVPHDDDFEFKKMH
jgi:hypothetical protein